MYSRNVEVEEHSPFHHRYVLRGVERVISPFEVSFCRENLAELPKLLDEPWRSVVEKAFSHKGVYEVTLDRLSIDVRQVGRRITRWVLLDSHMSNLIEEALFPGRRPVLEFPRRQESPSRRVPDRDLEKAFGPFAAAVREMRARRGSKRNGAVVKTSLLTLSGVPTDPDHRSIRW